MMMENSPGLFDSYASIRRFGDRVGWDTDTGKIYIGMPNKEMALAWQEFFMCANMLLPVAVNEAQIVAVIATVKCRYELVAECSQAQAAAISLFKLHETPKKVQRPLTSYGRGDIVKVLMTVSGPGDKRIGKQGIVQRLDPGINQLEVQIEGYPYTTWLRPGWVWRIGHEKLPPVVRWEKIEGVAFFEHHLFADGKNTRIHVGKVKIQRHARQIGMPEGKDYALFEQGQMTEFFSSLDDAKARAVELIWQADI